jgi:hypothetical protein
MRSESNVNASQVRDCLSGSFTRFRRQRPAMCRRLHLNTNALIFVDYAALVSEWLAENPLVNAGR